MEPSEENTELKDRLKNALPDYLLVQKLQEKDAEYDKRTVELRLNASKADGYKGDAERLQKKVDRLEESNKARQAQFEGVLKSKEDLENRLTAVTAEHDKILASRQQAFEILEKASQEEAQTRTAEIDRLKEQLKLISRAVLGEFSSSFFLPVA